MADVRCANCGSARVNALADAVGCDVCGAATSYDGELVHGPTAREPIHPDEVEAEAPQEGDEGVQPQKDDKKAAPKRTTTKTAKKRT